MEVDYKHGTTSVLLVTTTGTNQQASMEAWKRVFHVALGCKWQRWLNQPLEHWLDDDMTHWKWHYSKGMNSFMYKSEMNGNSIYPHWEAKKGTALSVSAHHKIWYGPLYTNVEDNFISPGPLNPLKYLQQWTNEPESKTTRGGPGCMLGNRSTLCDGQ